MAKIMVLTKVEEGAMKTNRFLSVIKRVPIKGTGRILKISSLAYLMALMLLITGYTLPLAVSAKPVKANQHWVGTWSTSPGGMAWWMSFNNQTFRQIVHITIGGNSLRVRFSNSFGTEPLKIDAASIGIQQEGAMVIADSLRVLTFGGSPSITIPPGARVLSDPVELTVADEEDLSVSLYVAEYTEAPTRHREAIQTSYISIPGDYTEESDMRNFILTSTRSWFWLSGVEVLAHRKTHAVATLGDSLTVGNGSSRDVNARYPDWLARRLLDNCKGNKRVSVLNEGIGGNRVLNNGNEEFWLMGINAMARLDRDVLTQSGITHVILFEGINDIGFYYSSSLPDYFKVEVTAEEIINGYKQIIERVHAMGLKILFGTLTPYDGASYWSVEGEIKREVVNDWIRTSSAHDGFIDFDKAVRDPNDPQKLHPDYNSGDYLHLNDDGYEAMAEAVDLGLIDRKCTNKRYDSDDQNLY
jgi:lysophospholipase L1-like esterase